MNYLQQGIDYSIALAGGLCSMFFAGEGSLLGQPARLFER